VTEEVEALRFNTAIAAMMEFLNEIGSEGLAKESLEKFTLALAPFAPHMAEELWQRLGHANSISGEKWPEFDPRALKEEQVTVVIQIGGKKRGLIEVPPNIKDEELRKAIVARMSETEYKIGAEDRFITVYQPGTKIPKLVNIVSD
jgi:leucyl-tRNA synthetase